MALKLVYVDDEEMLCEIFFEMISSEKNIVKTFTDAEKAYQEITANPPDLIFLDYRLYNITGDELAFRLPPQVPKVLVTGDILLKTKYPFANTFQKPVNYKDIRDYLEKFELKFSPK